MRALRRAIQLGFLALFVVLFARTMYKQPATPGSVLFWLDPLAVAVTGIAARAFVAPGWLSLLVVAATLVFGRFFCGFVCPLGTTIDLAGAVLRRKTVPATRLKYLKYCVLLFLLAAAGLGASFVGWFDPLAISERALTLTFLPAYSWLAGLVSNVRPAAFTETVLALCWFVLILGLGALTPRFWCRNVCPLGALAGFVSRFSLFKFRASRECEDCGLCTRVCPTGAIAPASETGNPEPQIQNPKPEIVVDSAECISCFACVYECGRGSMTYGLAPKPARFDMGRREAIASLGAALLVAPLAKSLLHRKLHGRLVRPPGSQPEPDFLALCLHCGRCMKACPTNGLQPCVLESGLDGLWTPRLVPRIGGCEKNCNLCGQVCPTRAIRNLPLEEKSYARIGTAVIDRSRCLAWEQDRTCLVCDEACSYNAIDNRNETIQGTTLGRPFVNEQACMGCGLCESRCPVDGPAAIQVFSMAEERKKTGWYKTDAKARLRSCGDAPGEDLPSGFIQ